jgi:hypothetical protein
MYNVLHSASSPGPSDAFRARPGPRRQRLLLRRRRGLPRVELVEPGEGGRLEALCEGRVVQDGLDEVLH